MARREVICESDGQKFIAWYDDENKRGGIVRTAPMPIESMEMPGHMMRHVAGIMLGVDAAAIAAEPA